MGFKALIQDDRNRGKMTQAIQEILELNEFEGALHNEIWLALYRFQEATTFVLKKVDFYHYFTIELMKHLVSSIRT